MRKRRVERSPTYGREAERVNLNTKGRHVLLLEFTSQMALDEGGLAIMVSRMVFGSEAKAGQIMRKRHW